MYRMFSAFLLTLALVSPVLAQSNATNGSIEGTVKDEQGALLPGVTITVKNIDTGDQRVVVTNEAGLYRAVLLPLGSYTVAAELQGFKGFLQSGIKLSVGESAVVNIKLSVGTVSETITVTADTPLLDMSRIDVGHTMSDQEVHALPSSPAIPTILVRPGDRHRERRIRRAAPGANRRACASTAMIDGNTNTEKDRAGLRLPRCRK